MLVELVIISPEMRASRVSSSGNMTKLILVFRIKRDSNKREMNTIVIQILCLSNFRSDFSYEFSILTNQFCFFSKISADRMLGFFFLKGKWVSDMCPGKTIMASSKLAPSIKNIIGGIKLTIFPKRP